MEEAVVYVDGRWIPEWELIERGFERVRTKAEAEIERAVENAKRSAWDKEFRRDWFRAAGIRRRRAFARSASPGRWRQLEG